MAQIIWMDGGPEVSFRSWMPGSELIRGRRQEPRSAKTAIRETANTMFVSVNCKAFGD